MTTYGAYRRGLSYNDEHFYVVIDRRLDEALERWRSGDSSGFLRWFGELKNQDEDPDEMLSTHETLADAEAAADRAHSELCRQLRFVDLGFQAYGCKPENRYYEGDDETDDDEELVTTIDDLDRLRAWCEVHALSMPSIDPTDPAVNAAITRIAQSSMEGELWLDYVDVDAGLFAADLVVDRLVSEGRADIVPDLWRALVGELTYVGPAPPGRSSGPDGVPPPDAPGGGGLLKRLFGR